MTDREYEYMMEVMKKSLEKASRATKEEALDYLMKFGYLDKDGNFTEPYKHLETVIKKINPA